MADFEESITDALLRTPRTVVELREWIGSVEQKFFTCEAGRDYLRLETGPIKAFREEVWPVGQFVDRLPVPDDWVVWFPRDNGPRDAELREPDGHGRVSLEVVNAVDGYDDRLRRELLTTSGHAPGFGPIWRDSKTRSIEAIPEARLADDVVKNVCSLVTKAIMEKSRKPYTDGTWLLVSFFDSVLRPDSVPSVVEAARVAATSNRFGRIYLVGQSQLHRLLARVDSVV